MKSDFDPPTVLPKLSGDNSEDDEILELLSGKWYIRKSTEFQSIAKQATSPDHIDLIKKLGSGGCGSVYLAKDRRDSKEYAVKRVPHVSVLQRAQNYRELLILQTFQHKSHIVHLEGFYSINE
jgi:hypothetical protein